MLDVRYAPSKTVVHVFGRFLADLAIFSSGCGFNLPVSSPSVAVQHLTAQPECPVAHAHINSGFDNFTPLSTADVGTPYLLPNTTTNNQCCRSKYLLYLSVSA